MVCNSFALTVTAGAEGITITGNPCLGNVLTATGADSITWYTSDTSNGTYDAISGESNTYTLDVSGIGKWIKAGSAGTYSEPIKDTTVQNVIYTQDFNEAPSDWGGIATNPGVFTVADSCLKAQTSSNSEIKASYSLPSGISAGTVIYEMKFKYSEGSPALHLYISDGTNDSNKGAELFFQKRGNGEKRIITLNSLGTAYIEDPSIASSAAGNNPQDGNEHTLRFMINMDSKVITASYDNKTYGAATAYTQSSVNKLLFAFSGEATTAFCIDSIDIYTVNAAPAGAPYVNNINVADNGNRLALTYDFIDDEGYAEGATEYEWYSAASENGAYAAIPNSNSTSISDLIHENRYLKVKITPKDSQGNTGLTTESAPILWDIEIMPYIDEDFSSRTWDENHFWNRNGCSVSSGYITATAAQEVDKELLLHISNKEELTSGKYIIEMKVNQTSGTDGFDFVVCGESPNENQGLFSGILFLNKLYLTTESASGVNTIQPYKENLANNEWHTIKYYIDLDSKKTEVMVDGQQLDYSGKYFADGLRNPCLRFKDDVTVSIDDIKVYHIGRVEMETIAANLRNFTEGAGLPAASAKVTVNTDEVSLPSVFRWEIGFTNTDTGYVAETTIDTTLNTVISGGNVSFGLVIADIDSAVTVSSALFSPIYID